jgi:hypothetical protein
LSYLRPLAACLLLALFYGAPASAININQLTYDEDKDELVMVIAYRGTNKDHQFSVEWTECRRLDDERSQILGILVDNQANDRALEEFKTEFRFDLASFSCRPARVSIKTSVNLFMSVDIPAPKKLPPKRRVSDARHAP